MSNFKTLGLFTAALLALSLILNADEYKPKVLCIDVGASRIKSALLYPGLDLDFLQEVRPNIESSVGKLNKDFPLFFSEGSSLFGWPKKDIHFVALGITGPIKEGQYYLHPTTGIPYELRKNLEKEVNLPVFLDNDAVIWARGALFWSELTSTSLPLPTVAITLGTGVGIALVYSQDEIYNISLSHYHFPFHHLRKTVLEENYYVPGELKSPSSMLGNLFFKNRSHLFLEVSIKELYQKRKEALVKDLNQFFEQNFAFTPSSYCFGGGHSRLLNKTEGELILNPDYLESYGVDGDIISLLGCLFLPYKPPATTLPN